MNPVWFLAIGIVAMLLQIGGFVSPGWLRLHIGEGMVDLGLFYGCYGGDCLSYSELDTMLGSTGVASGFTGAWLEFQIETGIGVAGSLLGLILTCMVHKKNVVEAKSMRIFAAICFLAAGIAAWVAAGKWANAYSLFSMLSMFEFPYSLVLTGIGATLALINALMLLVSACRSTENQPGHTVQSDYPMQPVAYPPQTGYHAQGYPAQGYAPQAYPAQSYPNQGYHVNQGYLTK
ncbi:hypothetical protein ScPMuIL_004985 [Solemya velum]